jgi:hypothetical protein
MFHYQSAVLKIRHPLAEVRYSVFKCASQLIQLNVFGLVFSLTSLYKFILTALDIANIIYFFTKQVTLMRR